MKLVHVIFLSVISIRTFAQVNLPKYESVGTVQIDYDNLGLLYKFDMADPSKNSQPIKIASDAFGFLRDLSKNKDFLAEFAKITGKNTDLENFFEVYSKASDKAIVFVNHPIDIEKFFQKKIRAAECSRISKTYDDLIEEKKKISTYLSDIQELQSKAQKIATSTLPLESDPKYKDELLKSGKFLDLANNSFNTILNSKNTISSFDKQIQEITDKYKSSCSNIFVEDAKVNSFILHEASITNEVFSNSAYLFEVKDILVISLGGELDLQKMNVVIEMTKSESSTSLSETGKAVNTITGLDVSGIAADQGAPLAANDDPKIKLSFVKLTNGTNLRTPYNIHLNIPNEKKEVITYSITEKNYWLFTIGFSAANIFSNPTTIKDLGTSVKVEGIENSFKNNIENIKANAYVMFDINPFGRDLNRLKESSSNIRDRFGVVVGVKLSKDPLQSVIGGMSYYLNNNIRLVGGLAYNNEPKEGATLQLQSLNGSLDYVLKNIDRQYNPAFFFGLSISPTLFNNLLKNGSK